MSQIVVPQEMVFSHLHVATKKQKLQCIKKDGQLVIIVITVLSAVTIIMQFGHMTIGATGVMATLPLTTGVIDMFQLVKYVVEQEERLAQNVEGRAKSKVTNNRS